MQELKEAIASAVLDLFGQKVEPELTRPAEEFGDYACNVALQLSKKLGKSPHDIAEAITSKLSGYKTEVAGPGFINIWLADGDLLKSAFGATNLLKPNNGKQILVEYGDPNPFKEMHIGHAYSYIVGDSIASILEASGARVERLSYHGDVGLHVAKALWALDKDGADPKAQIGAYYATGNKAYETDEKAKAEIDQINQKIYDQTDPKLNKLYEKGRQVSFSEFDNTLKDLGVHTAKRFYESESAHEGKKLVEQHLGKVFEKSDGAIVYKGEKVGLHTRVFITSGGLPTYETKDLGLAELKKAAYPRAHRSIIITAHEQAEYFKVMLAALAEFDKPTAEATTHLYHGFVSLSSGKMSSRTGEVYSAHSFIADVNAEVKKAFGGTSPATRNAAIKYGFLCHRLGSDIVYDVEQAVSLEGNSGPYLQYAYARAKSILAKAKKSASEFKDLETGERSLAAKISEYPEVVVQTTQDLMPSHLCTYLYELAQAFNRFYEHNRVVSDAREGLRLQLVEAYANVLAHGLSLLNIEAPEKV